MNTSKWTMWGEWVRWGNGRMSGRDVRWLMLLEWIDALGLCPNSHHWTHYHDHSHTHTLTYTNATPHIRLTNRCISIQLHLPLSYPTALSQVHHHLSHPSHIISIDLHQQLSAVYSAPTKHHSPLPLIHFLSDPSQLNLITSPLDHKSLILYPSTHSYQPPLHSRTITTLISSPYLHTLCNFPFIPTLPIPIP